MNQNISANRKGGYVNLIGVYWFNGNEPWTQTSKKNAIPKGLKQSIQKRPQNLPLER